MQGRPRLINRMALRSSRCATGLACFVVLLCVCVLTQMLGVPITLIGVMDSDLLAKSAPVSEDFSSLSLSLEPERPSLLHFFTESRLVLQLPVLATSVFRPPSI